MCCLSFFCYPLCWLSFFFYPLCCLSFFFNPLCCLSVFFYPLCCLSFSELHILITHLVSLIYRFLWTLLTFQTINATRYTLCISFITNRIKI
jgi:hypothetical protein